MSLVPFHAWAPDTYQGAPSPFVAFLSVAPKVASALVLVRLLMLAGEGPLARDWAGPRRRSWPCSRCWSATSSPWCSATSSGCSPTPGIAHMGYLLIAARGARRPRGAGARLPARLRADERRGLRRRVDALQPPASSTLIAELSGWGYRFPLLGVCLSVCMLSLAASRRPPASSASTWSSSTPSRTAGWPGAGRHRSQPGGGRLLPARRLHALHEARGAPPEGVSPDFAGSAAAVVAAAATLFLGLLPAGFLAWVVAALPPG
jgi:hypothetical protein